MAYIMSILLFVLLAGIAAGLFLKDFGVKKAGRALRVSRNRISCRVGEEETHDWKIFLCIAAICIISRVVMLCVCGSARIFISDMDFDLKTLCGSWNRMDSTRYLQIARGGYTATGEYNDIINIAFYPMYPLLVWLVHFLVGSVEAAAPVVSNLCLVFACCYLYKLVTLDEDESIARRSVLLLLVFPFAFFFSIAFSESTYFMLCVMCAYYSRKKKWWIAGVCGMFAAFSRTQGILMVVLLSYEYFISAGIKWANWRETRKNIRIDALAVLLVPLGYVGYLAVNRVVTGSWFGFMKYQSEYWAQNFGFFAQNVANLVVSAESAATAKEAVLGWGTQVVFFFLPLVVLLISYRKVRTSYFIYTLLYLFISFSPTALLSVPRYVMGAFPLFIMGAKWLKNRYICMSAVFISVLLLCIYAVAFTMEWYIY